MQDLAQIFVVPASLHYDFVNLFYSSWLMLYLIFQNPFLHKYEIIFQNLNRKHTILLDSMCN